MKKKMDTIAVQSESSTMHEFLMYDTCDE
jgi:hypothetical protein